MNLKIGIDNCKPGWKIILKQIGVSFSKCSLLSSISPEEYSVIIITETHNTKENEVIDDYASSGGAVLYSDNTTLESVSYKIKNVSTLYSQENTPFAQIGLADIFSTIKIPISKELHLIDVGLKITSSNIRNSLILPFNVNDLILSFNSRRKKFYANRKELPSEIVSEVSKGKLRKIVEIALEYLHHKRDLPFVHLWHQPYVDKNLFIFRLDTDFCSKQDANEMYDICKKNNISTTWFLDTDSKDRIVNYASMENQEMAIHCDNHFIYDTFEENYDNIKNADKKLKKSGIKANGFAAPFGDWNSSLDEALQKMELKYSSEFALDYDDLPFYPYHENNFSDVLQIPIHPISLGRLRRSHFTEEEMLQYYIDIIEEKIRSEEPVLIYHHPHHKHLAVFEKVIQYINSNNYGNMNMLEFCDWWRNKYELNPVFEYENNIISAKYSSDEVFIRVSTRKCYAILQKGEYQISESGLELHPKIKFKNDVKRIRKFHWRDILYNYESKRSKKAFK